MRKLKTDTSISRLRRISKAVSSLATKDLVQAHWDEFHMLCAIFLWVGLLIPSRSWEIRQRRGRDKHRTSRASGNPTGIEDRKMEVWVSQDSQDFRAQRDGRWERMNLIFCPGFSPGGHLPIFNCAERGKGAKPEVNEKLHWALGYLPGTSQIGRKGALGLHTKLEQRTL